MKRRLLGLLFLCVILCTAVTSAYAADADAYNAADVLYDLSLFSGIGTNADGSPNFDLDRTPTRHEAVTMLVSLLGKKEEALAGEWDTPFTDVADWAKPFVGYAYVNGLTSGTSATTYSGDASLTAAQYFTFVLKTLGYETGKDFQWDKSFEFAAQIGLTDGRFQTDKAFTRGDVTFISRNALDAKLKGRSLTLADKLIAENVFTKVDYKKTVNDPLVLKPPSIDLGLAVDFEIEGELIDRYRGYRPAPGTYVVTPYLYGQRFDEFEVEVDVGSGSVKKNNDGTFTVNFPGKDGLSIAMWYNFEEVVVTDDKGQQSTAIGRTKTSLSFNEPIPKTGFALDRNGATTLPKTTFGDNYSPYFVMDLYYNGARVENYTVEADKNAPFTASVQADGTMLIVKTGAGESKVTVTYQGKTTWFGLFLN